MIWVGGRGAAYRLFVKVQLYGCGSFAAERTWVQFRLTLICTPQHLWKNTQQFSSFLACHARVCECTRVCWKHIRADAHTHTHKHTHTNLKPIRASTICGVLLCIRCAGIHRSLGVHISKVQAIYVLVCVCACVWVNV